MLEMQKKGSAILPLHYGHPPEYLFKRMVRLSGLLSDLIIERFGSEVFLEKMSDPFWFHSLSLATGFDWNSSGTTTATLSALKEYYSSKDGDVKIVGGKGTKIGGVGKELEEIMNAGLLKESEIIRIKKSSKMVARVDQNLLQDGFDLYMHFIIIDGKGKWVVVQQGMNKDERMARRYHWIEGNKIDYYNDGRNGISTEKIMDSVLDLSTIKSSKNREDMLEIVAENPQRYFGRLTNGPQRSLDNFSQSQPLLRMDYKIEWKRMRELYEYQPDSFDELMNFKGIGKSTLRALSYLAELIYGDGPSYKDPVKYSFALGGKDGVPKPVNVPDYDAAIEFYDEALGKFRNNDPDVERILKNLSRMSYHKSNVI